MTQRVKASIFLHRIAPIFITISSHQTSSWHTDGSHSWGSFVLSHKTTMQKNNPRHANGNLRRKHRARLKAQGLPCHICGQPIHYDEPSDPQHPWSFVIDEIRPVSKWRMFGYDSPEAAAQDWDNLAPAHYICNQRKGNKTELDEVKTGAGHAKQFLNIPDGDW